MNLIHQYLELPTCKLRVVASERGLRGVFFLAGWREPNMASEVGSNAILVQAIAELSEYFSGQRKEFTVPLDEVGTDFQLRVWQLLREIPYGQTITYGELARRFGDPNAVRAVAGANARNPIGIVTPCHRVIGANGKLTGYAGGLENKEFLLRLEGEPTLF